MTQIKFNDEIFSVSSGNTVLDTLLENGKNIPNSCRAGACQSCLMQVTKGNVPEQAQKGLKDSHKAAGLFLACSCEPTENIDIQLPNSKKLTTTATVAKLKKLSSDVIELNLKISEPISYNAGQYVTLWKDEKVARSYSIANPPMPNKDINFHIRHISGGQFSGWVHNELKIGDTLQLQGPAGDCFYTAGKPEQNLLLIGTGTGLAPLFGIIQDALQNHHTGDIHLFHGALNPSGLYLTDELSQLAQEYKNFNYHPCVLNAEDGVDSKIIEGDLSKLALQTVPKPLGWKSFLCGNENLVTQLKKKLFLAGSKMQDIYADPFIQSK